MLSAHQMLSSLYSKGVGESQPRASTIATAPSVAIVDDNAGFRPESSAAHEPNDAPDERAPDGEVSSIKSLARSSDEPSSSSFHANSPARKLAFSPRYHVSADSNAGAALFVRATRMSFTAAKSAGIDTEAG